MVITHQEEIDGICIFGGTDDTQAITCECLRIKLQTDIHILTGSRTKALTCGFGGINQ